MESKVSISDCRKAIEVKGHLWLTIRGEQVLITKLAARGGRWVSGDIRFTRYQAGVSHRASAIPHCPAKDIYQRLPKGY